MSKEIILTQGKVAIVDDEDFEFLNKRKWHFDRYVKRTPMFSDGKPNTLYMHRLIMLPRTGEEIDHINNNKLDNRRKNLRVCTRSQNERSKPKISISCNSAYKGVTLDKRMPIGQRRWNARIKPNKKAIHIGSYLTEKEAALAYNKAALEHYGDFAYQNIIKEEF
ncbi:MAG: HNH endonuclease [Thermodesulfobacteriota bacterium]